MMNYEHLEATVVCGLEAYLKCPVIRSNQDAEPPGYPYLSYTVTTLKSQNKGTYQQDTDGVYRKSVNTIVSFTALSDENLVSVTLANKARDWLDCVGTLYLNDRDVIVQSVTDVMNRDNFLTSGYEYRNGFDCVFWGYDEVEVPEEYEGVIESADVNGTEIRQKTTVDELNELLEKRLDGEVS